MDRLKKVLAWYLVAAMFIIGAAPKCFAGFSPSEAIGPLQAAGSADLRKVQKFLETKMVRERLKDLGFTAEEIQSKLSRLSDQQIHQLSLRLDEMKVGGSGGEIVIIVFLIAIIVVLVIYATGHRIVVK